MAGDQTQQPGLWRQNVDTHDAADYRRLLRTLMSEGVGATNPSNTLNDCKVVERSPQGPGVTVLEGGFVVEGDSVLGSQGSYYGYTLDRSDVDIDAGDATNPRLDLVIAESLDTFYGDGSDLWRFRAVKGTPSPSPTLPATPANAIPLAQVHVAALQVNIATADITDLRFPALPKTKAVWVRVYRASNQTISSGSPVKLNLDTVEEDPWGLFDATNHLIQMKKGFGGVWVFHSDVQWDSVDGGTYRHSKVILNTSTIKGRAQVAQIPSASKAPVMPLGVPFRIDDDDAIELQVEHDRGSGLAVIGSASASWLAGVRLGA